MTSNDIKRTLYSKEELDGAVKRLGKQINNDYKDTEDLVVLGILFKKSSLMKVKNERDCFSI